VRKLFIGTTFAAMENHRTDSIPNDSYPVKSDRLLGRIDGASDPDQSADCGAPQKGVRLCRPSDAVIELLPAQRGEFAKEDGERGSPAGGHAFVLCAFGGVGYRSGASASLPPLC
jgi:hypothetical protein